MSIWQEIPKVDGEPHYHHQHKHDHVVHRRRSSRTFAFSKIPKRIRVLLRSTILIIAVLGLRRGLADLHDQYIKRTPTDFTSLSNHNYNPENDDNNNDNGGDKQTTWSRPEQYIRELHAPWIGKRYEHVRHLGSGNEGSADLYIDHQTRSQVVIKTIDSTLRNPIPESLRSDFSHHTSLWPTEIQASLLLRKTPHTASFMLISDYFILEKTTPEWSWATVSAYSTHGTLVDFSKQDVFHHDKPLHELDETFRANFNALKTALEALHETQLCHDDVKPDNIFVPSAETWLLGDLGNVRQVGHPWHAARSWTRQNQLRDCRGNDLRRLAKSYLWFLREAAGSEDFDREFWRAEANWSRLYWDLVKGGNWRPARDVDQATSITLGKETERELLCTTIPWQLWKPLWFLNFWM